MDECHAASVAFSETVAVAKPRSYQQEGGEMHCASLP